MKFDIRSLVLLCAIIAGAGCASRPPSGFEVRTLDGVAYSRAFDEAEMAIAHHFDIRSSDRDNGLIATRYSSEKSIDGIIKVRAMAILSEAKAGQATTVHLKVVRERFWEKWEFDHDLTTQVDLEGYDRVLANLILDEIQTRAAQ